jgi:hypothetical protein
MAARARRHANLAAEPPAGSRAARPLGGCCLHGRQDDPETQRGHALLAGTSDAEGGVVASRLVVVGALLLATALGCHAPRPPVPPSASVVDDVDALRLQRLNMAACRLSISPALDVTLSRRGGFGAWAWSGGPIEVSRDLIDLLDDDELAAAVAHEVGHLRGGVQWAGPRSLDGEADLETESRADQLGCRLLVARGIEPTATVRLLDKLSTVLGSPAQPSPFATRSSRARAACTR